MSKTIVFALFVSILIAGCSKNDMNNATQAAPVAHFSYTSSRSLPLAAVQFINQSVSPGPGTTYHWDFCDGMVSNNMADSFTHYYPVLGIYQPKLIQIDASGNMDTATATLNLADTIGPSGQSARAGGAAFTYHITPFYTTVFTNTSANATSYYWDFGDGSFSTSSSPAISKDFEAPGTYHVKLKAMGGLSVDSSEAIINFN